MKANLLCLLLAACFSAQAQVPSSFFAMTGQLTGTQSDYTVQFPEESITTVDNTNFTTSPIHTLGHPTTFAWAWVETCNPSVPPCTPETAYDWSVIDPELQAANSQGTGMILTIAWTPQWEANMSEHGTCTLGKTVGGKEVEVCSYPPTSYVGASSDWGVFVTELMHHLYHEITFTNPVKYIELWNEANTATFWGEAADSGYGLSTLVAMAQTAYPIIHNYTACSPNCPLVLSASAVGATTGPVPSGADTIVPDWIYKYLSTSGASGNLDGIAFHGYLHTADMQHAWPESYWTSSLGSCTLGTICNSGPSYRTCPSDTTCYGPLDTLVSDIRSEATSAGVSSSVPLVDTEGGWGSGDLDGASGTNPPLPLDTAYAARWYLLQAGEGATSNLKVASWYFWDPTCSSNCLQGDYGTLGYLNSSGTLIPYGTPGDTDAPGSGLAVGWLEKWLAGSTISSPCAASTQNSDIWSCSLTLPSGDSARIVWLTTSGTATYTNSNFSEYQDLTGCLQSYSHSITVAQQPVIVLTKNEGWGSSPCI